MTAVSINGRRIADYLERPVLERSALRDAIKEIRDQLPNTVIFGGMVRDFALGQACRFFSDIDLVSLASDVEIQNAVRAFNPKRNKFGGFRFIAGKWRFDIWSLSQTWAFKEGLVAGEAFDDLLSTTFFNVDAALFHLGSRIVRASSRFESGIRFRVLDVNLEKNPSPHGMARRAVRMAMEHDFAMSERLVSYIVHELPCRPHWLGEMLWKQMIEHVASKSGPFYLAPQPKLQFSGGIVSDGVG